MYGTSATSLTKTIDVSGASTTSRLITGLTPGTYYFAVMTLNSAGVASNSSNVAATTVQ